MYQENITRLYRGLLDQVKSGELKSYKKQVDFLRKNFHPVPISTQNVGEIYCETKRCQYPRLTHAPYKLPQSWHRWTKLKLTNVRFE